VELLSQIVRDDYDYVIKKMPLYSKKNRLVGEIDLLGVKDGVCDVFEVKCSHRIAKARHQLRKIRENITDYPVGELFFFCGASRALISV